MKIKNYEITCTASPTQIEGEMENGDIFYIRYRNCRYYAEVNDVELISLDILVDEDDYERESFIPHTEAIEIFWESYHELTGNVGEEE